MANEVIVLGGFTAVMLLVIIYYLLSRKEEEDTGSYCIERVLPSPLPLNQCPTRVQLADGYVGVFSEEYLKPVTTPDGKEKWVLSLDDDSVRIILPSKEWFVHVCPDDPWALAGGKGRLYCNVTRTGRVVPWDVKNFPKMTSLAHQNNQQRLRISNLEAMLEKTQRELKMYMLAHKDMLKGAGLGAPKPKEETEEEGDGG